MDIEKGLDLGQPGLKVNPKIIDKISSLAMSVFEKVNKHPENNAGFRLKSKQFYGAHPISLEKKHLKMVREQHQDWLVCEKTDGTRYLMYINNFGEVYLSGRGDDYHLVSVPMPPTMINQRVQDMSLMYIFDGELVIDERDGGKRLVYLLFDALVFNNELVFDKTYLERLRYCLQFVNMRNDLMKLARDAKTLPGVAIEQIKRAKLPRIKVCIKDFFGVESSGYIFKNLVPKLPHENDGLIYTRNSKPYPVGATSSIIKWKPPHYNTIDFLLVNNPFYESSYGKTVVDLYVTKYNRQTEENDYLLFDVMVVDEDKFNEIGEDINIKDLGDDLAYKNLSDDERPKIIAECKFDDDFSGDVTTQILESYLDGAEHFVTNLIENSVLSSNMIAEDDIRNNIHNIFDRKVQGMKGGWIISKLRRDKNNPNAFMTAKNVFNCIFENVTIEDVDKEMLAILQQPELNTQQMNHEKPNMPEEKDPSKKPRLA